MIERIFVRLETNICLLLMCNYMIFVYIGGVGNIYSYLNCLLLANLCLIHFVAIIILLQNEVGNYFHCIWSLEIKLMLSHQNERIFECSFV